MVMINGTLTDRGLIGCPIVAAEDGKSYTITNLPKGLKAGDSLSIMGESLMGSSCQQGAAIRASSITKHPGNGSARKNWPNLKE